MKTLLAKNHRDIVQQYKSAMTEQFNELNARLREVQSKNMELDENVATVNQRVEEITRQKVANHLIFFLQHMHDFSHCSCL